MTASQTIPTIDISPFFKDDKEAQQKAADQLHDACVEYGFMYLTGHGFEQAEIDEAFAYSRKFFGMSEEDRNKAPHPPGFTHHRGYLGIAKEKIFDEGTGFIPDAKDDKGVVPDIKETMDMGSNDNAAMPNIWPPRDTLPGFQDFYEYFFRDVHNHLVKTILRALAMASGVKDDYFLKSCSGEQHQIRLNHYPEVPVKDLLDGRKAQFGAHADWSFFTMLFHESPHPVSRLEVKDPHTDGYIDIPPKKGAIIMNIGDVAKRFTNDTFLSSLHRVGPRPDADPNTTSPQRFSIAYFVALDGDAMVETLPKFVTDEKPLHYKPATVLDYLLAKYKGEAI